MNKYALVATLSIVAIGGTSTLHLGQLPVSDSFDAEIDVVKDLGINPEFRASLVDNAGELTGQIEVGSGDAWLPLKSISVAIPAEAQTGIQLVTMKEGTAPTVNLLVELETNSVPPVPTVVETAPVVHASGVAEVPSTFL